MGWKVRDNMKLNDLLPAGARKVIYVTYALLTGLVAAAGQVLTSAAEVGFDTGDLPKYVTIVSTGLLALGSLFGLTAAAHTVTEKRAAKAAAEQLSAARRAEAADVDVIPAEPEDLSDGLLVD